MNGDTGRVAAIDDYAVTLALTRDKRVEVPASYVSAGHLEHGYALTAHLAQGATVDRAFVLGSDELYREWGYTALSRHREEARFYVSAAPTSSTRAGFRSRRTSTLPAQSAACSA